MRLIGLIAVLIFFTSCDCLQRATGVVLDKSTGQPIDSVQYRRFVKGTTYPYSAEQFTDTNGSFHFDGLTGGMGDCHLTLQFSRNGYATVYVTYPPSSENDTVYLEKNVFSGPGFNVKDTNTFNELHRYILRNGTVDSANASSMADRPWYVVYHTVCLRGLCLAIDHTDRIYFNRDDTTHEHVGNLLKEDGKVVIEDADAAGKKEITAAARELWERAIRSK